MDITDRIFIDKYLSESAEALRLFMEDDVAKAAILRAADAITTSLSTGHKVLTAGNGGSAGDAQHIAGEFVSRLFFDRAPLAALALTTDTSVLTAVGNDYGFDYVFERQVLGLGNSGDTYIAISTSGKSPNILRSLEAARTKNIATVGFTGEAPCPMDELCSVVLHIRSHKTAVIQQLHIVAAHMVCGLVERRMFSRSV